MAFLLNPTTPAILLSSLKLPYFSLSDFAKAAERDTTED